MTVPSVVGGHTKGLIERLEAADFHIPDVTPESHPDHHTVGKDFMGHSWRTGKSARWFCASHDACGYNMVNRSDPSNIINVSERAIGRTFWEIYQHPASHGRPAYENSKWGFCRIDRDGNEIPDRAKEQSS